MTKKFICLMDDNSIFRMPSPYWDIALRMNYPISKWREIKKLFRQAVSKHWREKTIPTKFRGDEPWQGEYKNHADLGEDVMYPHIRAPLMGLILAKETGGKVLAIQEDSDKLAVYSDKKRREITIDEVLG